MNINILTSIVVRERIKIAALLFVSLLINIYIYRTLMIYMNKKRALGILFWITGLVIYVVIDHNIVKLLSSILMAISIFLLLTKSKQSTDQN